MATVAGKAGSAVTTTSDPPGFGYTGRMYYGFGTIVVIVVIILLILLLTGRL